MATEVSERYSGYVWHSMPDQVRCTSVAERRASLAAAQKAAEEAKEKNNHPEPIETQQNGQHTEQPQEEVIAPVEEEQQQQVEEQQEEQQKEEEPQQQEEEPQQQEEEPQAASAPEEEPTVEEKAQAEAPAAAPAVQEPTTTGTKRSSKTKHSVHFRGSRWEKALKTDRKRIEAAFRKDVHNATGIDENRMESVEFSFDKVLFANFIVRHHSEDKTISEAHAKLNLYKFPLTTALYPKS